MLFAVLVVGAGLANATLEPWACSSGQAVTVGGVKYKTKVALVQDGYPPTPFVKANNTKVQITVKATLAATGKPFPFNVTNPYTYEVPPKKDGSMIVGFDVGFGSIIGKPQCATGICGMTKDSTRMLCIPPEEGYGSISRPGIPADSTLLIEIKCLGITVPSQV
jgi:FKBP-type peptidyl-prolyl cis-trans isomerase